MSSSTIETRVWFIYMLAQSRKRLHFHADKWRRVDFNPPYGSLDSPAWMERNGGVACISLELCQRAAP